jgi:hypothetical protein
MRTNRTSLTVLLVVLAVVATAAVMSVPKDALFGDLTGGDDTITTTTTTETQDTTTSVDTAPTFNESAVQGVAYQLELPAGTYSVNLDGSIHFQSQVDELASYSETLVDGRTPSLRLNESKTELIISGVAAGINSILTVDGDRLIREYELLPGVSPRALKIQYNSATQLSVNEAQILLDGDRVLADKLQVEKKEGDTRSALDGGYVQLDEKTVGIYIQNYDPTVPTYVY